MDNLKLLINGDLVAGDGTTEVINPATGQLLALAPRASERQLDEAVAAAKRAFPDWSRSTHADRRAALLAVADAVEAKAAELGLLLTLEQGKPLQNATQEAKRLAAAFRHYAKFEPREETLRDDAQRTIKVRRRPHGVIAAITPCGCRMLMAHLFGSSAGTTSPNWRRPSPAM